RTANIGGRGHDGHVSSRPAARDPCGGLACKALGTVDRGANDPRKGGVAVWCQGRLGGTPLKPKLLDALNVYIAKVSSGSARSRRDTATSYFKQAKRMYSATSPNEMKKFDATLAFFQKYGQQYGFDGLMLVAQGYQESQLDQSTRSPVGAIGLMQ